MQNSQRTFLRTEAVTLGKGMACSDESPRSAAWGSERAARMYAAWMNEKPGQGTGQHRGRVKDVTGEYQMKVTMEAEEDQGEQQCESFWD